MSDSKTPDTAIIIPAAGSGRRVGAEGNKLLLRLGKKTILEHTVQSFTTISRIKHIYLAVAEKDYHNVEILFTGVPNVSLVLGGAERQDSVYNVLQVIRREPFQPKWVLVHDGARPFCSQELILRVIKQCEQASAAIPLMPVSETIRQVQGQQIQALDRQTLFATQTPQGASFELMAKAYEAAKLENRMLTDDASAIECFGHSVAAVEGCSNNLKVTTPTDVKIATWLMENLPN